MTSARLQKLRAQFHSLGIDAFLVTFQPHLRYLSGFSGSNGVGVVSRRASFLITDGRYAEQVRHEVRGWNVSIARDGLLEELQRRNLLRPGSRIGFDGNTVIFAQLKLLKNLFPKIKFLPKVECIEKIAAVKDAREIAKIKKAVAISDLVFDEILGLIKPGVHETDIAAEISYRQRKHGAEADAFESIIASGSRGALPHGKATWKKIRRGELVTIDFGCVCDGYHSDLTRTVAVGKPSREARNIYGVVLNAQLRAIAAARSGIKTKDLDAAARGYIRQQGFDKYFRHSLGHGLGLQIHEAPRISVLSTATLQSGNVVTIEPGIYIPNFGGVRIEDDIVITDGRCKVLNRSPKELIIL